MEELDAGRWWLQKRRLAGVKRGDVVLYCADSWWLANPNHDTHEKNEKLPHQNEERHEPKSLDSLRKSKSELCQLPSKRY